MSALSPLAASLIAAGSALAGGLISTGGQMGIEWSRGRRERLGDETTAKRELRLAVRLVTEELAESMSLIEEAAQTGRYWVAPRMLPTNTWNQYRTDIATVIEAPLDWRLITAAYDSINNLNWTVDHRRRTSGDTTGHRQGFPRLPDDQTRDAWTAIRNAIETLERTIGVAGPASRVMRERDEIIAELWPYGDGADFDEHEALSAEAAERNLRGH